MALSATDSEGRVRNASPGLRFFLVAVIAITLMVLDHRGGYLEQIRVYLGAAMYPVQVAIDSPAAGLRWMRENLALRERLIAENRALRERALADAASLQRMAALQAENSRFRALLDSKARVPDRVVVGTILEVDMDPLRHRVVLDKGGQDGALEGQALLDAGGVVGQITRNQIYASEAILITDPDHAVPVEVVRNGLRTIAVGTGSLEQLSLPFLTRNADVKAGDLLVTSGLGGTFPAGYPVGTVTNVDGSSGDAFLEVSARPAASLDRLHEVLLVYSPPPTAAPAGQPSADRTSPDAPALAPDAAPDGGEPAPPPPGPSPEPASPPPAPAREAPTE